MSIHVFYPYTYLPYNYSVMLYKAHIFETRRVGSVYTCAVDLDTLCQGQIAVPVQVTFTASDDSKQIPVCESCLSV